MIFQILVSTTTIIALCGAVYNQTNLTSTTNKVEFESSKIVKCDNGTFDVLCDKQCHCLNDEPCNIGGECPNGGVCQPNYHGSTCSDCAKDFYGANCSENCHCLNDTFMVCDQITGECDGGCAVGYNGTSCQEIIGFPVMKLPVNVSVINTGQNVTVSCSASGAPRPNITIISYSGLSVFETADRDLNGTLYEMDFMFGPILFGDVDEFVCHAENIFGKVNSTINIIIIDPPYMNLFDTTSSTIFTDRVQLEWVPWQYGIDFGGFDGDQVEYLVEYRRTGILDWSNASSWQTVNNLTVDGLSPDTVYDFTLKCRRPGLGGQGPHGPIVQILTKCGLPNSKGIPQNLTMLTASSDSLYLSWEPPIHVDLKCELKKYLLRYSFVDQQLGDTKVERIEIDGRSINYTLENLNADTRYEISLTAVTDGPRALSDAHIVANTTNLIKSVPDPVVNITYVQSGDPTSMLVSWKPPVNSSNIREYILIALLIVTGSCDHIPTEISIHIHTVKTSNTQAYLTNLRPFSEYSVVVKSVSDSGFSEPNNLTVKTAKTVPGVRPSYLTVSELGSTFVVLQWNPIPCHEINDDQIMYRYYVRQLPTKRRRKRQSVNDNIISGTVSDNFVNVTGLKPYALYEFSVRGVTSVGDGPDLVINQWTTVDLSPSPLPPSSPSPLPPLGAPVIFTIKHLNSSMVVVQWRPPKDANDNIKNYKVQCIVIDVNSKTEPDWETLEADHDIETSDNYTNRVRIYNLRTGSAYCVRVTGVLFDGRFGHWADKTFYMEDDSSSRRVALPGPPQPPQPLILSNDLKLNSALIHIYPVEDQYLFAQVIYYEVIVAMPDLIEDMNNTECLTYSAMMERLVDCWVAARLDVNLIESGVKDTNGYDFVVGDSQIYGGFFNGPLLVNQKYAIMMRTIDDKFERYSYLSSPAIRSGDDNYGLYSQAGGYCYVWQIPCVWFFIMVILIVILLWVCIACCMFCKMRNHKKIKIRHVKTNNKGINTTYRESHFDTTAAIELAPLSTTFTAKMETFKKSNFFGPIRVRDLPDYVNLRNNHPTNNFEEEFKRVIRSQSYAWSEAKRAENIKKNRYGNILPYDQTRVKLDLIPGIANSDYINASYIDGYDKPKSYIVTQGPKENTFHDFWRMVWQENASVIVMLTALIENKKKKCDQYWPNLSRLYGDILVHLMSTDYLADVVIRHFELKIVAVNIATSDVKRVTHYHYVDWPDLSVPSEVTGVLNLRQAVREELPYNGGPIIVHCSGGAGRSGTFIAIDALLKQAFDKDYVHVHEYVNKLRTQRTNLVQTLEQYKFVYDALLEALQSGNTKVSCGAFRDYFKNVSKESIDGTTLMEEQFETLNSYIQRTSCFPSVEALTTENACKNRDPTVLPLEHSRVKLKPISLKTPPPYINAILCKNFQKNGELLVTQMPLDCTIEDFWTMVYQFKSTVVVMLNDCEFIDENTVPGQYWPNDGCTQYGDYQVEVIMFEEKGMVNVRTLRLTNVNENVSWEPHIVIQLQFLDWTPDDYESVPSSTNSLVTLLNMADILRNKYGGPITVHCTDGASRSGVFCVARSIKEQVAKGEVDVFQAVKRIRHHRPQFITSKKQYRYCYELAMELMMTTGLNNHI